MQYQMGSLSVIPELENRSDEQLLSESKHRAAAKAILGARAAERYEADAARRYFNEALAGVHPQERPMLRQMMKAAMAQAERRPDDLRDAMEKLGQEPPSNRQLMLLRLMSLIAPPPNSGVVTRVRGFAMLILLVVLLVAIGFGLAKLIALPLGGVGMLGGILLGLLIVAAVLGVLALVGRRRQEKARVAQRERMEASQPRRIVRR
jgi:C4-dicarboxylate-specific signal transduction histidine kinase